MKLLASSAMTTLVSAWNKYDFDDVKKALNPLKASAKPNATSTKGGYIGKGTGKSPGTWTKVMVAETAAGAPPKVEEDEVDDEGSHEKEVCDVEEGVAGDDAFEDVDDEI